MRIKLTAAGCSFSADEYALVAALEGVGDDGAKHYLVFQRSSEEERAEEDWGVHLEYDEQSQGAYDHIALCLASRGQISVTLSRHLPHLDDVEGFDVDLRVAGQQYEQFLSGLQRIFRGAAQSLLILE